MSNVVTFDGKKMSAKAVAVAARFGADDDDLTSGLTGGFGVISIRGSKWRIKKGGEEHLVTNADGEPMASLRVVILKANKDISKTYYEGGFVEGSTEEPDCWSNNGKQPDDAVPSPVAPACASCPKNAFGSRITDNGKKAKACADVRRVAVVPENDFANEAFGGPMLLRVPAASLSELAAFGNLMKSRGFKYNTVVARISFDPDTSYPRLKFNAIRALTDEELGALSTLLDDSEFSGRIESILNKSIEIEAEPAQQDNSDIFEEPAPAARKAPAPAAAAPATAAAAAAPAPRRAAAKKPTPAPAVQQELPLEETDEPESTGAIGDDELDAIMAKLDALN